MIHENDFFGEWSLGVVLHHCTPRISNLQIGLGPGDIVGYYSFVTIHIACQEGEEFLAIPPES